MKPRQWGIALALAATLAAAFWPSREQGDEVVGAVIRASERAAKHGAAKLTSPGTVEAPRLGAMSADLFPAQTWQPPPPPTRRLAALPPPDPLPPPLPFQYLGRWREAGGDVIFLDQGNQVLRARIGDVLAGWRLDQAGETDLTFTWIALNMQQTLRIAP